MRFPVILVAVVALAGARVEAQARDLRGVVTDTTGYPLPNVEIRIIELGRFTRTDIAGRFSIPGIRDRIVDLTFRRLGYEVRSVRVSLINGEGDSLRIALRPEPLRLPEVTVQEQGERHPFFEDYEKRRQRGIGTFVTHKDLEQLNSSYPSDAFRRLPGMRLVRANGGMGVRFASAVPTMRTTRGAPTDCPPTIWVDGQAAPGMEIDDLRAGDIYGIEIYRGLSTTPAQFAKSGLTQCGTIVVWTRRRTK